MPHSIPSLTFSSRTYSRTDLLSLARTPNAEPRSPRRLASFSAILRKGSVDSEWGVDEQHSTILETIFDNEPVSKALPVSMSRDDATPDVKDVLFAYRSVLPHDRAAPVTIDFTNPDPFAGCLKRPEPTKDRASSVFQSVPSSTRPSSATLGSNTGAGLAISLGERFTSLRRTSHSRYPSPSNSIGSESSASSISLNPFACPFPLPVPEASPFPADIPSLPLPKVLPSSLPARPHGPLPPVFVKRESAALPQPMALPDVAPLGEGWEGERGMSGNERRRRTSEMSGRPERLVRLGERLKENVTAQGRESVIAHGRGVKT